MMEQSKRVSVTHDKKKQYNYATSKSFGLSGLDKLIFSDAEIKADNYEVCRYIIDMIGHLRPSKEDREKEIDNINLLKGRWLSLNKGNDQANQDVISQSETDKVGVDMAWANRRINHYSLIDKVGQHGISSLMTRNKNIVAKDYSKASMRYKDKLQEKRNKEGILAMHIRPAFQRVNSELEVKYSGADLQNPEVAKQIDADREMLIEKFLDPRAKDAYESDDNLPTEGLFNTLYDVSSKDSELEYNLHKGAYYALATGKEFYRRRFAYNRVWMEVIPSFNAGYILSNNSEFVEDGVCFGYDRYLTPVELVTEYFHIFKNKDFKEIKKMMVNIPSAHFESGDHDHTIRYNQDAPEYIDVHTNGYGEITDFGEYRQHKIQEHGGDILAKNMFSFLQGEYINNKRGIKVSYSTWKWLKKAKRIERKIKAGNGDHVVVDIIRGEHYKLNKAAGDLRMHNTAVPVTYEAENCGDYYFNIGEVSYSYKSANPADVASPRLGVYGGVYNSLDGAVKNLAFVDPMKPFQLRVNMLNDALNEKIANHIGDVLVVDKATMMEADGGIRGFLNTLKMFNVVIKSGKSKNNEIYSVKVGDADFSSYKMYIDYYENKLWEYGNITQAERSSLGQYASGQNIENSLASGDKRKYSLFYMSRKIRERVANALVQGAFYAYEHNDFIKDCYMSDIQRNHYDQNFYEIAGSNVVMEIEESFDSQSNLRAYKQYLVNYLNQGGDIDTLGDVVDASTMREAKEIARKATRDRRKLEQENIKSNQQAQASLNNAKIENEQNLADREDARELLRNKTRLQSSWMYSLNLAHGNDVNENNISDVNERADKDRILKEKEIDLKHSREMEKIKTDRAELQKQ